MLIALLSKLFGKKTHAGAEYRPVCQLGPEESLYSYVRAIETL